MTVTDPYTGIGVITRGVFDSDMAAISLSLHSSCNDIALNEKNSPSFCQIHFYRGIFHLLSSCTLSTLRAFNSSSFHPSSPQIHPFSMIPVTPHLFQSTHSLRSATIPGTGCGRSWPVSIHALLAECDASYLRWRQLGPGFNPRTPCGVRPRLARTTATDKRFQSTHSLRSATPCSIPCLTSWMSFQSTHSLRSATQTEARTRTMLKVSIHALVRVRHTPRLFHNQTGRFQSTHS